MQGGHGERALDGGLPAALPAAAGSHAAAPLPDRAPQEGQVFSPYGRPDHYQLHQEQASVSCHEHLGIAPQYEDPAKGAHIGGQDQPGPQPARDLMAAAKTINLAPEELFSQDLTHEMACAG